MAWRLTLLPLTPLLRDRGGLIDGGRFLLRMLELRDVDGGVFPV